MADFRKYAFPHCVETLDGKTSDTCAEIYIKFKLSDIPGIRATDIKTIAAQTRTLENLREVSSFSGYTASPESDGAVLVRTFSTLLYAVCRRVKFDVICGSDFKVGKMVFQPNICATWKNEDIPILAADFYTEVLRGTGSNNARISALINRDIPIGVM